MNKLEWKPQTEFPNWFISSEQAPWLLEIRSFTEKISENDQILQHAIIQNNLFPNLLSVVSSTLKNYKKQNYKNDELFTHYRPG